MFKCQYCDSSFKELPENCKNCGASSFNCRVLLGGMRPVVKHPQLLSASTEQILAAMVVIPYLLKK